MSASVCMAGKMLEICSDNTFECRISPNRIRKNIKISAGQRFAELYDASCGDDEWRKPGEEIDGFVEATVLGPYGMQPWGELVPADYSPLTFEPQYPKTVTECRKVKDQGTYIYVDFHSVYFGEILKPEFLYLVTNIVSDKDVCCTMTFPYSRLWCTYGEFYINGTPYLEDMRDWMQDPRAGGMRSVEIVLKKGSNFFVMDCSGQQMGYFTAFRFDTEAELCFRSPFDNEYAFTTVSSLYNYMDPDGDNTLCYEKMASINTLLDEQMKEELRVALWGELTLCALDRSRPYIKHIEEPDWCSIHPQHHNMLHAACGDIPLKDGVYNLVIPDDSYTLIAKENQYETELVIDFGEETVGYIQLELQAEAGNVLDISACEYIDFYGKRQEMDGVCCAFRYVTASGFQRFTSSILRGFRYLIVTVKSHISDVRIRSVTNNRALYPVADIGEFSSSSSTLNEIYTMSKLTTRLCMLDTFVDCPGNEQTFWLGDYRNEALISYGLFNSYRFIEHNLAMPLEALNYYCQPNAYVPTFYDNIMPTWTLLWMFSYKEYYQYSGNLDFVRSIYPRMKQLLSVYIQRIDDTGLIVTEWNDMMDWAPVDIPAGTYATNINAETYRVLCDMADIAAALGIPHDEEAYRDIAARLKKAVTSQLWSEERKAFADCRRKTEGLSIHFSRHANVMAYICDCVNVNQKEQIEEYLSFGFPADFTEMGSPFAAFFYLEALSKSGNIDAISQFIIDKWTPMLKSGSKTCYETFPGWEKDVNTRSYCHAWSAAPAYCMVNDILGLRPAAPGFSKLEISPCIGELEWAKGTIPTPKGAVRVLVERREQGICVRAVVPEGIQVVKGFEGELLIL